MNNIYAPGTYVILNQSFMFGASPAVEESSDDSGSSILTVALLSEDSSFLVTESGDSLIQE
jgi:hypothetical protein